MLKGTVIYPKGVAVSRVEEEVRRQIATLTSPGLVAVSGGADSVALLRAMKEVCLIPFTAVHVNHKLRGDESEGDEAFVATITSPLDIPFRSTSLPIPERASIESTARELRYAWFQKMAIELDCGWLATGHTADDQAETVLHRIIRGTGIAGLAGIQSPSTTATGVSIIRPMLRVRRSALEEYLNELNQPFRTDSSNADRQFTRNRIRHELLPLLVSFNPKVVDSLTRLAERAKEQSQDLSDRVMELLNRSVLPPAGDVYILNAEALSEASPLVVRELFSTTWKSLGWPLGEMTAEHWHRLATLQSNDFPGGISVRRAGKVVQLRRKS